MGYCLKRVIAILWRIFLGIVGFILGLILSILFYELCLRETDFIDDAYKTLMFISTAAFLSFGFACSRQIACLSLLTLPEFVGRAGRRSIQATIMILVIAGPIHNLGENGEETVRFLGCIKDMLWDIFMTGVDLVTAPIQHIISDLKKSASQKQHEKSLNASMIKELMAPLEEEIEGDSETARIKAENDRIDSDMNITRRSLQLEALFDDTLTQDEGGRIVKKYKKKIAYRCEEIFTKGTESCIKIFQSKYDECSDAMGWKPVAWIVCWPMKLDFICNILSDYTMDSTCSEVEGLIDENFGKTYKLAKKGIDDLTKSFNFRINYLGLSQLISLDAVRETRDAMLEQFLESKKYVEWYLTMIKRSLTLSYLLVIFNSIHYLNRYFAKLSHDNVYLTLRFRRIDRYRRASQKRSLLPLKKFELKEITSLRRFLLTSSERKKFYYHILAVCLQAGVVFTVFALDHIFKELLSLLKNHAEIEIKQEGIHVLAIQVTGDGFLAKLIRRVVKDVSVRKKIDTKHFTKPCLPNPRETPVSYHYRVTLLFCVLLLNAYFEAHFSRFRHCVADHFFPERHKKRVLWLYNEMLRRRRRKQQHLKRKVLENVDKFRTFMPKNPFQLLAHLFPKRCANLKRCCKSARRKCILCLANGAIYYCPRCGFAFCTQCFADVDRKCLVCIAEREMRHNQTDLIGKFQRSTNKTTRKTTNSNYNDLRLKHTDESSSSSIQTYATSSDSDDDADSLVV